MGSEYWVDLLVEAREVAKRRETERRMKRKRERACAHKEREKTKKGRERGGDQNVSII